MLLDPLLNSEEKYKRITSEQFLMRIDLFSSCLTNNLGRNKRKTNENLQRYESDQFKIKTFHEHLMNILSELFDKYFEVTCRISYDRAAKWKIIKDEQELKMGLLEQHINDLQNLKEDITSNLDDIVVGIEQEPFHAIISRYNSNVDSIQKTSELQKLEHVPTYDDIIEHPRKIESFNMSLQSLISNISHIFDYSMTHPSLSLENSMAQHEQLVSREEIKKINECFYSNLCKSSVTPKLSTEAARVS